MAGRLLESGITRYRAVGIGPSVAVHTLLDLLRLSAAGIEGQVVVQFAIDTLGRVIARSIAVVHSDHQLFTAAVQTALLQTRFAPADARGRKVVELVQQSFGFVLR